MATMGWKYATAGKDIGSSGGSESMPSLPECANGAPNRLRIGGAGKPRNFPDLPPAGKQLLMRAPVASAPGIADLAR